MDWMRGIINTFLNQQLIHNLPLNQKVISIHNNIKKEAIFLVIYRKQRHKLFFNVFVPLGMQSWTCHIIFDEQSSKQRM